MKKILLGSMFALALLAACKNGSENVTPAGNQTALGMVLQTVSATSSSNLILLEDGRTISPVSGFTLASVKPGNKFQLSFEPVSYSEKGILNVKVTAFSSAATSAFSASTTASLDTSFVKSILQGTHTCTFTYSTTDSLNTVDTTKLIDQNVRLQFSGNRFASLNPPSLPFFIPGGEGIFFFEAEKKNLIFFANERPFPAEAPPGFILDHGWHLNVFDKYILIWRYGGFYIPSLNKHISEFSSFNIPR